MTKDFRRLPSPHPEEFKLAPLHAAPLIGKIILSWNDFDRDMYRFILMGRNIKEWKHPPDRKLDREFLKNLDEWIKLFLGGNENEEGAEALREKAKRLLRIRNDIVHNIWMVRLDSKLGVAINIVRDRFAYGQIERLPALAADLVRLRVDIIVTGFNPNTVAAMKATTTIPIVMPLSIDPVGSGLVASLARPGGNVTGLAVDAGGEILGKRFEMLKEMLPNLSRLAIMFNPDVAATRSRLT